MGELKLTEKQRAFCREYVACGDAKRAAELAGYAPAKAGYSGRRALASLAVQRELARLRQEWEREYQDFAARSGAVAERGEILQFLTGVMRGDLQDKREVVSNGKVREVCERPKLSERTKAAELLGKSQRLFSDKPREGERAWVVRILGENDLLE